jgi:hypothetical protein
MCKTAQRFTALTLATAPLIVKTPDLNGPKQCTLTFKIILPILSQIWTANTKLAHPMDCLHTNYIKNNTLENSQIQQGIKKKEIN